MTKKKPSSNSIKNGPGKTPTHTGEFRETPGNKSASFGPSGSKLEHLLKEKFQLGPSMITELHNMPWETLANLAHTLQVRVGGKRENLRAMQRQVDLTKLLIAERLKGGSDPQFDAKFYLDLIRLLEKMEQMSIEYEVNIDEFLLFLHLLIEKMRRERLVVYDAEKKTYVAPKPGQPEFGRYKI